MRRLKVLHLIPALTQGGAERLASEIVSRTAVEIDHFVVTMMPDPGFFDFGGVPIESLGLARGQISPAAAIAFRATVKRFAPDVLHGWLYHGNALASLARGLAPRLLWSIHNTTLDAKGSKSATRLLARTAALFSSIIPDRIVYCAEEARELHQRLGYSRAAGVVILNGVDLAAFRRDDVARAALRASWGANSETILCGFVGRLDDQKGIPVLLQAFRHLREERPQVRLVLAGAGFEAGSPPVEQLLNDYEVRDSVLLLGARRDIPAILSALDVLTLASGYGEALPMAALEAAAAGLPIVTTDVGEAKRLVLSPDHVVRPKDPAALAAALCQVCDSLGADRFTFARKSRDDLMRREFDINNTARSYAALYADPRHFHPSSVPSPSSERTRAKGIERPLVLRQS